MPNQPASSDFCRGTGGAAVPAVTQRALTGMAEAGDEAAGGGGSGAVGGHVVDLDRSRHNIVHLLLIHKQTRGAHGAQLTQRLVSPSAGVCSRRRRYSLTEDLGSVTCWHCVRVSAPNGP